MPFMLPPLLASLAGFFFVAHLVTLWVAWRRCRPAAARPAASQELPPVTVVRPLCGIETFSAETLEAAFGLDYPAFELIFCVARDDDPILPLVRDRIEAHPQVAARLLVGDDPISRNPKLNNMVKGWREARHDWIAFIDSNVLITPDYIQRCVATWRADTGAVSAPPVGSRPSDAGGWLECAFLNSYAARYQYAVDTFGHGFAQGKTLFYQKRDLDRSGLRDLATEPAEDAATTKMVRRMGRRVRLAPPSPMPIGARTFAEVWSRQLRWARLRRATFALEYLPEVAAGVVLPAALAALAAWSLGLPVAVTLAAYVVIWFGAEMALASACGWPAGWRLLVSLLVRDALMPALFVRAFTGRSYTWKGAAIRMEPRRPRRVVEAKTLQSEEGI